MKPFSKLINLNSPLLSRGATSLHRINLFIQRNQRIKYAYWAKLTEESDSLLCGNFVV